MEEHCYAECHLWGLSLMVSLTNKPFRLIVIMLNVVVLSVIMLNVVVLSVVMLSVVALFALISKNFLSNFPSLLRTTLTLRKRGKRV
jgi:hypothetical protein